MRAAVLVQPGRIEMEQSGLVDLDAIVTARFPLEAAGTIAEALDSDRTPGSVQTVVAVS